MRPENPLPQEAAELVFRSNLREFGRRAAVLSGLVDGNKLPLDAAYDELAGLWIRLESSRVGLDLDDDVDVDFDFDFGL